MLKKEYCKGYIFVCLPANADILVNLCDRTRSVRYNALWVLCLEV